MKTDSEISYSNRNIYNSIPKVKQERVCQKENRINFLVKLCNSNVLLLIYYIKFRHKKQEVSSKHTLGANEKIKIF